MNSDIEDLLKKKDIQYQDKGKDFLVLCFNPDHDESNPSLRIDRETGKFNCLSCGFHGNIFHHFNEFQSTVSYSVLKIKNQIAEIQRQTRGMEIPEGAESFEEDFRNISASTFKDFKAFTYGHQDYENRIIFPITNASGIIQCFNGRHMYSSENPKYKIYPERASLPLYPLVKEQTIILVEGLFDAINLYDKGIKNAVCMFGAHNISYKNAHDKLLPYLIAGTQRILLLLDGDKAGKYATKKLTDILKAKTDCEIIDISNLLPKDEDAGSLNQKQVNKLAESVKNIIDYKV